MKIPQLSPKAARAFLLALIFSFSTCILAGAQPKEDEHLLAISIDNFGRMDGRFYRGGQPKEGDYKALAGLGIQTVIDLRDDPASYEKRDSESAGMRYVNIPMSDRNCPSDAQIDQFLKLVNDPATGKFYVHCLGGRHRTGVIGAIYRYIFYNWDYDRVYKEMRAFDFYTRWGHGALKTYVEDYYHRIKAGQIHPLADWSANSTILGVTPELPFNLSQSRK